MFEKKYEQFFWLNAGYLWNSEDLYGGPGVIYYPLLVDGISSVGGTFDDLYTPGKISHLYYGDPVSMFKYDDLAFQGSDGTLHGQLVDIYNYLKVVGTFEVRELSSLSFSDFGDFDSSTDYARFPESVWPLKIDVPEKTVYEFLISACRANHSEPEVTKRYLIRDDNCHTLLFSFISKVREHLLSSSDKKSNS